MQLGTILYHTAGSGGDIISTAWTINPNIISAARHSGTNASGRAEIAWDQTVLDMFPKTPYRHWYTRIWENDLEKLANLDAPFFFNVCDIEQARMIKSYLGDKVTFVGVTYTEDYWNFVLDAFCYKVLDAKDYLTRDDIGENFLNVASKTPEQREWFIELGKNKKLGEWYREQALAGNVSFPPKQCTYEYDVSIDLSELLNKEKFSEKLESIVEIYDAPKYYAIYDEWHSKQRQT